MAGHSKWNNIKNKKGAEDAKRGKIFSQLAKQIRSAVKEGKSGDPKNNPNLRMVMDKARAANMPKDNIQRAIDKGLGKNSSGQQYQEITYEGYGPGGVGFIVIAVTDNVNRTGSEVRYVFSKHGGSLAGPNAVAFMFSRNDLGEYTPSMPMAVEDEATQKQLERMIDAFTELDDVEEVIHSGTWEGAES